MKLAPGDLILVQSPGRWLALGRRLGGNPYDHVAVVGSDGRTINIDKPGARRLDAERLLRPSLAPRVLRPRFGSDDERARFVADIEALVGAPYDVRRTLALVAVLIARRWLGRGRLRALGWERPRWICTDAVLLGLERNAPAFRALRQLPLDFVALGSGTTNDLLEMSRRRPDLLAVVGPEGDVSPVA